jgi:transposase-like protein
MVGMSEFGDGACMMWRCRHCGKTEAVRAGKTRLGKQRWQCLACGRRTVENPYDIDPVTREIVDRMIKEGLRPTMIARLASVSSGLVYKRRREFGRA